jgi:hypothetical protein
MSLVRRLVTMTSAALLAVPTGLVVTGGAATIPVAWADKQTHTLVLNQQPPSLRPVDGGAAGVSVGDALFYEAHLTGEHGESGTLTGVLLTADVADPETGDLDADRLGQLSYDLGNGNTLLAIGETVYRADNVEIAANLPQLRAVVGGTGTFMGARGQVSTTRNPDGGYRHEFTLIDD